MLKIKQWLGVASVALAAATDDTAGTPAAAEAPAESTES